MTVRALGVLRAQRRHLWAAWRRGSQAAASAAGRSPAYRRAACAVVQWSKGKMKEKVNNMVKFDKVWAQGANE